MQQNQQLFCWFCGFFILPISKIAEDKDHIQKMAYEGKERNGPKDIKFLGPKDVKFLLEIPTDSIQNIYKFLYSEEGLCQKHLCMT